MSFIQVLRERRKARKDRRDWDRAVSGAATPGVRAELIYVAQRETLQHTR